MLLADRSCREVIELVCVCVTVYSWCVSVLQCTVGVCLCYSVQLVCVYVTVYSWCVSVLQCTNLSPEAAQGRLGLVSQKENVLIREDLSH